MTQNIEAGTFSDMTQLREYLSTNGVDPDGFSKKGKGLDTLLAELQIGDCKLALLESGELVREVEIAGIKIWYHNDGCSLLLRQKRQIFSDGTVVERESEFSVTEKRLPNESFEDAARRGLWEELGIEILAQALKNIGTSTLDRDATFENPTLKSSYHTGAFEYTMTDDEFHEGGYREVQDEKTTIFEWQVRN